MNPKTLVQVYENDNLIYQGTYSDVEAFLGHKRSTIEYYAKTGRLVKNRFLIKRIRDGKEYKSSLDSVFDDREHQYYIDYIIYHLYHYGNCAMKPNPEPYIKEVRRLGYEFKYREEWIDYTDDVMRSPKKKPKSRIYILEGRKING